MSDEAVKRVRETYEMQRTWWTWGPKPTMTMDEVKILLGAIDAVPGTRALAEARAGGFAEAREMSAEMCDDVETDNLGHSSAAARAASLCADRIRALTQSKPPASQKEES